MQRIFPDFAYGPGPRTGCWWDETVPSPNWPCLGEARTVDVVVVGGGFTGISAALHLAERGVSVAVLEAETPGWGASGRNGGFCCLGGSKLGPGAMARRYGPKATRAYGDVERRAVELVAGLLKSHGIEAEAHSRGETVLAHSARAWRRLRAEPVDGGILHDQGALEQLGLGRGFFGGMTTPVGFALNPRKYLFGLAAAAQRAGAELYQASAVTGIARKNGKLRVSASSGSVTCETVLVCTNGYSSDSLPGWMSGRYLPAQSTVLVTRPMSDAELNAAGWTSDQMAYDTRHLLHYFRLMPDRRFLFGMRGGLLASPNAEAAIRRRVRRDFDRMFPAWSGVEATHSWSGLVCLSRNLVPFVGPIPETPGVVASFAYHGNGVAMGTYCGREAARLALGDKADLPEFMTAPNRRFPLGRFRRWILPPVYAGMMIADAL